MNITTHIRNIIFLWRQRNKTEISKNADAEVTWMPMPEEVEYPVSNS